MTSLILRTATRFLMALLLLFSVFVLLRGHDEPGGGFVGGLVAAAAFSLYVLAYDVRAARLALRVDPRGLAAAGLLVAGGSGLVALFEGAPYLGGRWGTLPVVGLPLGTPVVFDVGVYLVAFGTTLTIVFALAEE